MSSWLITGANRGIGLEVARQLKARGDAVIATCRNPESAADLRDLGIAPQELDVRSHASILALSHRLAQAPIDVLVNNAGIGGSGAELRELDFEHVSQCFETNAVGPLRITSALLGNLEAGERRLVVHLTSRMGSIGDNSSGGYYAYRMSKAALNMANRSMAHELAAKRITCTVVHPGWVRTDMGGRHGRLSPEESVRGLLELIDKLSLEDSGQFFEYTGTVIPW